MIYSDLSEEIRNRVKVAQVFVKEFSGSKKKSWVSDIPSCDDTYSTELPISMTNKKVKLLAVALKILGYKVVFEEVVYFRGVLYKNSIEEWFSGNPCWVAIEATLEELVVCLCINGDISNDL